MKPLNFIGTSLDDLRNFPDDARRAAGFELYAVQCGLEPSDWRPMPTIGLGVKEIRLHVLGEWRIIFVASLRIPFMCSIRFRRKGEKRAKKMLSWRASVITKSEGSV